jgi:hypothetical protein
VLTVALLVLGGFVFVLAVDRVSRRVEQARQEGGHA